jgi:chitinase
MPYWAMAPYGSCTDAKEFQLMFVEANDPASLQTIAGMKSANPNMKFIASVGGWNFPSNYYSKMVATSTSRAKFINSAKSFLSQYGFDGIDIDWEYPVSEPRVNPVKITCQQFRTVNDHGGSSADTQNIVDFFKELRAGLPGASISLASQANLQKAKDQSVALLHPYLDYFHLMVYDFTVSDVPGGTMFSPNAPLFNPPEPSLQMSIDYTVQGYLAMGVPPGKMQLGVAYYGHTWWNPNLTPAQWQKFGGNLGQVQGSCCGVFTQTTGAKPGKGSQLCGSMMYSEIKAAGFEMFWDNQTQSDIGYLSQDSTDGYTAKGTWLTYNSPRSLTAITKYALKNNLAGVFAYDSSMDTTGGTYELSKLISNTLKQGGGGHICDPDVGCNVCSSCCKSYLKNQDDCDSCVKSEC